MLNLVKRSLKKRRYKRYLKSPQWKRKRFSVLRRDNFKCVKCGSHKNLQVHHLTYNHIFNEPLCDLVTLCKKCHRQEHNRR